MPLFYEYSGVLCNFHFNSFDLGAHGRSEMFRKVLGNLRLKTIVVKILTDKSSKKNLYSKSVCIVGDNIAFETNTLNVKKNRPLFCAHAKKRVLKDSNW